MATGDPTRPGPSPSLRESPDPITGGSLAAGLAVATPASEHRRGVRLASVLLVAGLATVAAGLVALVVGL